MNPESNKDRQSCKAYWSPNYRADRIVYIALVVLAIALALKFN